MYRQQRSTFVHALVIGALTCTLAHADTRTGLKSGVAACGDINGDGVPDLAVASRDRMGPDRVWILSGRDGSLLRALRGKDDHDGFGARIVGVGDFDADGTADVAIEADGGSIESYTRIVSGKTGDLLLELDDCGDIAPVRDLDHDGHPDLLYTALPVAWSSRFKSAVIVRFGQYEMKPLEIRPAPDDVLGSGEFGDAVCWTGDIDGDGLPDIAASSVQIDAPYALPFTSAFGVGVFSSKDGHRLWESIDTSTVDLETAECGKTSILRLGGDLDGDGVADLVVGLEGRDVFTLSGRTGERLSELKPLFRMHNAGLASSLDVVGDLDGDGAPDLVVSAHEQMLSWSFESGFVCIVSSKTGKCLLWLEDSKDFGFDACAVGDLDRDGIPDVAELVERELNPGWDPQSISAVNLRSGKDGHMIWQKALPGLRLGPITIPRTR